MVSSLEQAWNLADENGDYSRFLINICRIKEFRMKIEIKVEIKITDRHMKRCLT